MKAELLTTESVTKSLKSCRKVTLAIIDELLKLQEDIERHNGRVLRAKTSGTTVTALGTGLAVSGLIMAPFTLGTSLILSSVGAVTSVTGAAANLITDLVDRSKRNKFIENIHTLSTDQQESKSELTSLLHSLNEIMEPLMDQGLSETQALYAALKGDRYLGHEDPQSEDKGEEDFEWIQSPDGKWKPIRKFCFKAGLNSLKLVKNTRTLTTLAGGGARALSGGVTVAGGTAMTLGTRAVTSGGIFTRVGHFLGSAAFKGTMAAVGVVFTTIDIALLVKEWKSVNPTSEAVQTVINELTDEVEEYDRLVRKLEEVEKCKLFLAWISDVPVVATSPFSVEALLSICRGDFDKVEDLYGAILCERSKDKKLAALDIIYSHKLSVGSLTFEKIHEKLAAVQESTNEDGTHPTAEPVCDLKEIFFKMTTREDSIGVSVFNVDVLKVYQEVIETFLEDCLKVSFDQIKERLSKTAVLKDCKQPLPSNVIHSVQKVLVSYHKYGDYINGNKWEYNVTIDLLKECAVAYLAEEYGKLGLEEDEDDNSSLSCQLDDLVDVLVNHKSFVDPLAAAIWTDGNVDKDSYEQAFNSFTKLFRELQFKIPLWACEIKSVLGK